MGLLVSMLMLAAPATATAAIRPADDAETLEAMQRELNLAGDELARFHEKADAERAALAAWKNGESGKEFAALARQRAIAAKAKDYLIAKKFWDQMRPLGAERLQLHREKRRDVLAALAPERQKQWAGYVLFTRVVGDLHRLDLSEQQRTKLRGIADERAATAVAPEKLAEDPFLLFLNDLRFDVIADARQRVLTPEQKQRIQTDRLTKASRTPPREGAPVEKE